MKESMVMILIHHIVNLLLLVPLFVTGASVWNLKSFKLSPFQLKMCTPSTRRTLWMEWTYLRRRRRQSPCSPCWSGRCPWWSTSPPSLTSSLPSATRSISTPGEGSWHHLSLWWGKSIKPNQDEVFCAQAQEIRTFEHEMGNLVTKHFYQIL